MRVLPAALLLASVACGTPFGSKPGDGSGGNTGAAGNDAGGGGPGGGSPAGGNGTSGGGAEGGGGAGCGSEGAILHPGGHCYHLFVVHKSWPEARDACLALGAGHDLASVTSIEEHRWIETILDPLELFNPAYDVWIGGNDRATEGDWGWINGEPWRFTAWLTGQPNDSGGEDCAEHYLIEGLENDAWNDNDCDWPQAFLCEGPSDAP